MKRAIKTLIGRPFLRPVIIPVALVLLCFALSPMARAAGGPPTNCNTSEGNQALFNVTTGVSDTALGGRALYSDTTGSNNTAVGCAALFRNTFGDDNTATGAAALFNNIGDDNTANGYQALFRNTTGINNTANGASALFSNTTGLQNTANGFQALTFNTTGSENTAVGDGALHNNTTGSQNIALGFGAGFNVTGDFNIDIGDPGALVAESYTIRIGDLQTATYIAGIFGATVTDGAPVLVDTDGHLGTAVSSARFKDDIKPMDRASEAILALKPVTFRYKKERDPKRIPRFGLVAEDVEKVNPDLVVRDKEGKPYSVRYDAVNAMLLNEFLKEHRKVQAQEATISELKSTVAQQQKSFQSRLAEEEKQIAALASGLQKVSAQLELSKPAAQIVLNNQ
jgi:hypothetical protein